jgi:predicted Zn-dependent protease
MKHRILFTLAAIALLGGLVAAQREHAEARPGAQSVLYLVADSERDLTTLPSHFTRLSDDDEVKYGGELAAEETGSPEKPSADDVEIENVVRRLGGRVASQAHRRLLYRFHYLPDRSFINAFALPGGHVFIGRGLIEHMTTEDELATVLGHEVEHIDHYHCAERLQTELALRKIPLGGVLAIPIEVFQSGTARSRSSRRIARECCSRIEPGIRLRGRSARSRCCATFRTRKNRAFVRRRASSSPSRRMCWRATSARTPRRRTASRKYAR